MTHKGHATTMELANQGELGGLSAWSLASSMQISFQTIRRHLRRLQGNGLVEALSNSLGLVLPSNLWHLTSNGPQLFFNGPASVKLALELLRTIEANFSHNSLLDLLNKQFLAKGRIYKSQIGLVGIKDSFKKLISLRNKEGKITYFHICTHDYLICYINLFHFIIKGLFESFLIILYQGLQLIYYIFLDCEIQREQWKIHTAKAYGFNIISN